MAKNNRINVKNRILIPSNSTEFAIAIQQMSVLTEVENRKLLKE